MPDCCSSENFFYGWYKAVFSGPEPPLVQSGFRCVVLTPEPEKGSPETHSPAEAV